MKIFDSKTQVLPLDDQIASHSSQKVGSLGIIQVGNSTSSEKYIKLKLKLCDKLGIKSKYLNINEAESDEVILSSIKGFFADEEVLGGIIQLPLPRVSLNASLNLIPLNKDIDLISHASLKKFYSGDFTKLSPAIHATKNFIDYAKINLIGANVIIIGYGDLVGKPLAFYLKHCGCNVIVMDSRAVKDFENINYIGNYNRGVKLDEDLVILCTNVPSLVSPIDISAGCNVIDFGSNVVDGKTVGNLSIDSDREHLGFVSPSPGGMGPLVLRYLIMNFLKL